ncbi:hypothetical protein [Arthrobacter sp. HY1533]|uniref:hypothetical protein n=1 Tax=Arthrobacter sp. HY1533 TaxID=2970919 RepID=UPI0022B9E441|nr:hypothetical protein [Arthrobacter sp. HY1533]
MGNIIRKDATITPTGTDEDFPGTFQVILSAPTKDRDGETLLPDEWKQPLPSHITFDQDHAMTVAGCVGSGAPYLDEDTGNLVVDGTYSSIPEAQKVRTLVNEGHIRTTSVAFMSEKSTKDGVTSVKRELLNGAFVAIPSNREALVLSSKGFKAGARNSKADADAIQSIHDGAAALGAACSAEKSAGGSEFKALAGSLEATQERASQALRNANSDAWVWLRGTVPDGNGGGYLVYEDSEGGGTFQQDFTDDGKTVTLVGDPAAVSVEEVTSPRGGHGEDDGEPTGSDVTPADGTGKSATPAGNPSGDRIEESEELESMKKRALALGLRAKITLAN